MSFPWSEAPPSYSDDQWLADVMPHHQRVRDEGEVYNHRHWHDQLGPGIEARLPEVTPVSL